MSILHKNITMDRSFSIFWDNSCLQYSNKYIYFTWWWTRHVRHTLKTRVVVKTCHDINHSRACLEKIKSSWLVWCTFIFHLHIELFIYHSFSIIILCFTCFCNIDPEIDLRKALDSVDRLNNKNTTPHVAYESLVNSLQSLITIYIIAW